MTATRRYSNDGRAVIDPPCEFGHRLQAMECPSCCERKGGTTTAEWWAWYRKRRGRQRRAAREEGPVSDMVQPAAEEPAKAKVVDLLADLEASLVEAKATRAAREEGERG